MPQLSFTAVTTGEGTQREKLTSFAEEVQQDSAKRDYLLTGYNDT